MGKSHDRGSRQNRHSDNFEYGGGGGYQPRAPRPRLEWKEVHTLQRGQVQAVISLAVNEEGNRMYSFSLGRPPYGEKPGSKFLTQAAFADLKIIGDDIASWIDADKIAHANAA